MKSYCVRANDSIGFQGQQFLKFIEKTNFGGFMVLKIESCPPS